MNTKAIVPEEILDDMQNRIAFMQKKMDAMSAKLANMQKRDRNRNSPPVTSKAREAYPQEKCQQSVVDPEKRTNKKRPGFLTKCSYTVYADSKKSEIRKQYAGGEAGSKESRRVRNVGSIFRRNREEVNSVYENLQPELKPEKNQETYKNGFITQIAECLLM